MKLRIGLGQWAMGVAAAGVLAGAMPGRVGAEEPASLNARRFEAIKKLAGEWVAIGEDGKPSDKLASVFRVTAGGSTVVETLFPGTEREMVTVYHLDGANLLLTHYCMLGNQPRLRAEPTGDAGTIAFRFVGATNLKSPDDHYMAEATFTLTDSDHYRSEWASCKEGKSCHRVAFNMVRKGK